MPHSREEEAGLLYVEGAKAVSDGGHELRMLASHLRFMIKGTEDYPGALWRVRIMPPHNTEFRLARFIDYLLKPVREGLGLPDLHFLRQVLKASERGEETLALVRKELAREGVDFDEQADLAYKRQLAKKPAPKAGGDRRSPFVTGLNQSSKTTLKRERGSAYLAARLKRDRPDLSDRTLLPKDDMLHLSIRRAAIEAGIIKTPSLLDQLERLWARATPSEREAFLRIIT